MSDEQGQVKLIGRTGNYSGTEILISKGEFTIGRNPGNDLVMDTKTVSANHAKIVRSGDHYEIHDLNSTNGTYVNGKKVASASLRTDDVIRLDIYEFTFVDARQVARTVVSQAPDYSSREQGTVARGAAIQEPAPVPKPHPQPAAARRPQPQVNTARFESNGSLFLGMILGVIVAFIVGVGGLLLVNMIDGVQIDILTQLKGIFPGFAAFHTHVIWTLPQMTWGLNAILTLVSLVLALFIGGLLTQAVGRANRLATAFVFALFYVLLFFVLHLATIGFDFNMMQMSGMGFLGITEGWLGLAALYGYFFGVSFVVSFIGSLFGRR